MTSTEMTKKLCKERKIPISKLEKDCGFSNGYIGQLKKELPFDRAVKVSEYLGVNLNYLMGLSESPDSKISYNEAWDLEAKRFSDIGAAFFYQLKSMGWTCDYLDDEGLYSLSNGTVSFKISTEERAALVESTQEHFKSQLLELYKKSSTLLFPGKDQNYNYVNAAHAIPGASEEDIQHDEDIMNDENF